jgi:dTDP-4-amino-4,6-dideoxygalactose transaminase
MKNRPAGSHRVLETKRRIQSSIHYPSFKNSRRIKRSWSPYATPLADEISQRELTLPLYPTMGFGTVDLVTNVPAGAL